MITTIAGNGNTGETGNGAVATSATLTGPNSIAVDSAGNVFIADYTGNTIRKITASTGKISVVAGTGTAGYTGDGAAATSAELNGPNGIGLDGAGNLYVADYTNNSIRKVDAVTGIITTVAGTGTSGFSGDGGLATSANLFTPAGAIGFDSAGNLYFADLGNNRLRSVSFSTGIISTVAGNGSSTDSGDHGAATAAGIESPSGVAIDASGNLYTGEWGVAVSVRSQFRRAISAR